MRGYDKKNMHLSSKMKMCLSIFVTSILKIPWSKIFSPLLLFFSRLMRFNAIWAAKNKLTWLCVKDNVVASSKKVLMLAGTKMGLDRVTWEKNLLYLPLWPGKVDIVAAWAFGHRGWNSPRESEVEAAGKNGTFLNALS